MRARASWRRRWPSRDWLLSRSRRRPRFGDDDDGGDSDDIYNEAVFVCNEK